MVADGGVRRQGSRPPWPWFASPQSQG